MAKQRLPLNISYLANEKSRVSRLLPVQSQDIYDANNELHPQGLYSTVIFGELGEHSRQTTHSYIDMKVRVLHPKTFRELVRVKGLYKGIMSGSIYAVWDSKLKDFVKSDYLDGETGYSFFIKHFHELVFKRNDSAERDLRIDLLNKTRDTSLYSYCVVLPAGLRDIRKTESGDEEDDLNPKYRKILRIASTISDSSVNEAVLDVARWNMQVAFIDVFDEISKLVSNRKKGFLLEKWSSRNLHGGTRNVITGIDPSNKVLGAKTNPGVNHTVLGLHQSVIGAINKTLFFIRQGVLKDIIGTLPANIPLIDPKTLKRDYHPANTKTRDTWGTIEGLTKLVGKFAYIEDRHKPVMIEGKYAALLYQDEKSFLVIHDIDELPDDLDRTKVKPITWAEWLYIDTIKLGDETILYNTRYPILTDGSIYPSFLKVRTTTKTKDLVRFGTEEHYPDMPVNGSSWLDSAQPHPSKLADLGADFDGDKMSFNFITSIEAVRDDTAYLKSKEQFMKSTGGLRYGVKSHIAKLSMYNATGGME